MVGLSLGCDVGCVEGLVDGELGREDGCALELGPGVGWAVTR